MIEIIKSAKLEVSVGFAIISVIWILYGMFLIVKWTCNNITRLIPFDFKIRVKSLLKPKLQYITFGDGEKSNEVYKWKKGKLVETVEYMDFIQECINMKNEEDRDE